MRYATKFSLFMDMCDAREKFLDAPSTTTATYLKVCYDKCVASVIPVVGKVAESIADDDDFTYNVIGNGEEFSSEEEARSAWVAEITDYFHEEG